MKLSNLEQQIIIKALLGLIDNACLYQVENKMPGKTRHEQVLDMVDKLGQESEKIEPKSESLTAEDRAVLLNNLRRAHPHMGGQDHDDQKEG